MRDNYGVRLWKTIKRGQDVVKSRSNHCGRSKEGKVLSDFFLLFVCYKYLKGVLGGRFVGVVKRTEMLQPLFYKTTL